MRGWSLPPSSQSTFDLRPARHARVVTPLLLSILMTCVVSLVSTLTGVGGGPGFLAAWLEAWGVSWLIARSRRTTVEER